MKYKVYLIGHPIQLTPVEARHNEVFTAEQLPISLEPREVPPSSFHRVMTGLMHDEGFLGAKVDVPYKQTALAYCQELSVGAQGIGAVNTLVRRSTGLILGQNTDVLAFVQSLKEQGVEWVRTALILGAGGAARVALAGLRELGCARYMVGYRHPRRPAELSSQFKGVRRQISYFPLNEMGEFFAWAAREGVFARGRPMPPPSGRNNLGDPTDGIKRWDLLVNATPVGQPPHETESLVTSQNFLRCFDRVLDLVPANRPTPLTRLAEEANVPAIRGQRVFELQAEYSRELWVGEYRRRVDGRGVKPGVKDYQPAPRKREQDGSVAKP